MTLGGDLLPPEVQDDLAASFCEAVSSIAEENSLQELAALRFASETILKVRPLVWHPELLYVLSRRHINQEMIGVTFDVIAAHCPNLATRSPLDRPPFDKFYKRAS